MAGSAYEQKMEGLYKIKEDAWNLYQVVCQDADVTSNDWGDLGRICERLSRVHNVLSWNWSYPVLLSQIEDEKSRFFVEKQWNLVYEKRVIPTVKQLLDLSKQWKFNDYRIINFQNDLREWAQGMYDLLVNDAPNQEDE